MVLLVTLDPPDSGSVTYVTSPPHQNPPIPKFRYGTSLSTCLIPEQFKSQSRSEQNSQGSASFVGTAKTMKTKNIFLTLVMLSLVTPNLSRGLSTDELSRRLCLLRGQYYFPGSDTCSDPFDEDSCEEGFSWLLPTSVPGEIQCQNITDDLLSCDSRNLAINDDGEAYCIKDEKLTAISVIGEEQIQYRQTDCPENMIRIPDNFMEDTKPCPGNFTCNRDYRNAYSFINRHYYEKDGEPDLAKKEKGYARSFMVCNERPQMACVPNTGSMEDNSVLLDSFKVPKSICKENPCSRGKWPWLSEDGYQRCLVADTEELKNCPRDHFVVQEDKVLKCQTIVPFFTENSQKCRKGRIYRKRLGKCVSRFFG